MWFLRFSWVPFLGLVSIGKPKETPKSLFEQSSKNTFIWVWKPTRDVRGFDHSALRVCDRQLCFGQQPLLRLPFSNNQNPVLKLSTHHGKTSESGYPQLFTVGFVPYYPSSPCFDCGSREASPASAIRGTQPCRNSIAFCSPAESLTFGALMETPLVGKRLKS